MFKNILIALDGSVVSERSLPWVERLFPSARIGLMHAVERIYPMDAVPNFVLNREHEEAEHYLSRLAQGYQPRAHTMLRFSSAASGILDTAEEFEADLIALTTHGRSSIRERFFGGTTEKLIHHSRIPLFIVPAGLETPPPEKIRKILVPLDGSRTSALILSLVVPMAREHGAEVVVLHAFQEMDIAAPRPDEMKIITEIRKVQEQYRREIQDYLTEHVNRLTEEKIKARSLVLFGEPVQQIRKAIELEKPDLMMFSAHGYGAVKRLFLGSVASKMLQSLPVPTIVARVEALRRIAGPRLKGASKVRT